MDIETLLYKQLDKYGDELTPVIESDLLQDISEIVTKLKSLSGFETICDKMHNFLSIKNFSKDDFVDIILIAIHKVELY